MGDEFPSIMWQASCSTHIYRLRKVSINLEG